MGRSLPVVVGTPSPLAGIGHIAAGGAHTCAQMLDGTVDCWGDNSFRQAGGATGTQLLPTPVTGITTATQITAGASHSCALLADTTVKCWGSNASGQLGTGSTGPPSAIPTLVFGLSGAVQLASGADHTCALLSDTSVACWGENSSGQLGDTTTTDRSTATPMSGLTGVNGLTAGTSDTCALKSDGTARCWGSNTSRQLGDGTRVNRSSPVSVEASV